MKQRQGVAAWPREEPWLQDGDEVALWGHLDAKQAQRALEHSAGTEDGVCVRADHIEHVYARRLPTPGDGRIDWPYPRGRGAFAVTVVQLVNADEVSP